MASKSWRDEPTASGDFQCACGCGLQLSRGDLADAIRLALVFDGRPRTWGVTYTAFPAPRHGKGAPDEPVEKQPCSGCRSVMVELPTFASKLLADQSAPWPRCAKCRIVRQ